MAKYSSKNSRGQGLDNMISALQDIAKQVASEAGVGGEIIIPGKVKMDDTELKNIQKEAKKGIEVPVTASAKKVNEEIEKAVSNKRGRPKIEIEIDEKDIFQNDTIQKRVRSLEKMLSETADKTFEGGSLTTKQAEKYVKGYIEYKKYADAIGFEIKELLSDVFDNITDFEGYKGSFTKAQWAKKGMNRVPRMASNDEDAQAISDTYQGITTKVVKDKNGNKQRIRVKTDKPEALVYQGEAQDNFEKYYNIAQRKAAAAKRAQMRTSTTSVTRQKPDGTVVTNTNTNQTSNATETMVDGGIQKQNQFQAELDETTEKERQMAAEAKSIAQSIASDFGLTKGTVESLTASIKEMMSALSKGEKININNILGAIEDDKTIKDMANAPDKSQASDIRSFLRGKKIKNLPDYKEEFGDGWQRAMQSLGIGIITNGSNGIDLMQVLSEMNDAIGTQFDLTVPNATAMVNLVEAISSGMQTSSEYAKAFVDHLVQTKELDLNKIESSLTDAVDQIYPGVIKKKQQTAMSDDDFMTLPDDEDVLPFNDEDKLARPFKRGTEAAQEFKETVKEVNENPVSSDTDQTIEDNVKLEDTLGRKIDAVNSELLRQSALVDETSGKIKVLWHSADVDFDEFDLSYQKRARQGMGSYFYDNEDERLQNHGNVITQWFANVSKIYEQGAELSKEQIKKVFENYKGEIESYLNINDLSEFENYLSKDNWSHVQEIFGKLAEHRQTQKDYFRKGKGDFVPGTSSDIFESLGYDAYKTGSEYVIFDPSKIIKATSALYDQGKELERVQYLVQEYKENYQANITGNGGQLESVFNMRSIMDEMTKYYPQYLHMIEKAKAEVDELIKGSHNETPVSPAKSETEKFLTDSKAVFEEFGKTQQDILPEWQELMNAIFEKSMTAEDALKKLRETLQSLSSADAPDMSAATDSTAEAHERAAEAAKEHAEAVKEANEAERESTAGETNNRDAASSAREAAQASEEAADGMKEEAESAREAANAEEDLGEARRRAADAVPPRGRDDSIYTRQTDYDEDNYSYTKYLGYAQRETTRVTVGEDGEETSVTTRTTDFRKLEDQVIKTDEAILKLYADLQSAKEDGKPTQAIQKQLDILGKRSAELTQELQKYYDESEYLPNSAQVKDFNKRRREASLLTTSKLQQTSDTTAYKEQEKLRKSLEQTDALVIRQRGNLDNLRKKYVDNADVQIAEKDQKALEKQYNTIKQLLDGLGTKTGKEATQQVREKIGVEIQEYKRMAQQAIKDQKVASQFQPYSLDAQKDRLNTALNKLGREMQETGADTKELEEELQKLKDSLAEGDISNTFLSSLNNQLRSLQERFKDVKGEFDFKQKHGSGKSDAKNVRSELTQYANARKEYQKLYSKALGGDIERDVAGNITKATALTNEEFQRLQSTLQTIVSIESNWNEEKANGINLSERQAQAKEQLNEAVQKSTQQELESNALNEKAVSLYTAMQDKIQKMSGQTAWRTDGWADEVTKLQDALEQINVADVVDEGSFKEFKGSIDNIMQAYQKSVKSVDFQPVAKDWQAKAHADLAKWMDQNKMAAKAFKEELKELAAAIDDVGSKGEAQAWSARFQGMQEKSADQRLLGKSLGDRFKDQFKNTMTSLATYYLSFQDFIRYGREAIQIITELDTQLTEMRKVSNESLQTLQQYQLETFDIADRVGTTAAQIQASTADWLRLGEDLQNAKKSAEYSTLLLNVSEFTDISAATDSLVAMSQAYQDMDKLDIIDKLNNIGNNFSISTSQLAESLQRSAGTLKVAGNSLDEAIALTVAGNQVLQNPLMVGQSLRTISLRLTGTSVEDMQEAGEEIDGLITTQSKLRKTIMDATKVQGNNYTGFDILDSNGNYKTTYEMLKGIAEVWKEIGEEDKKMGTNRKSFLLETIAGKTRAAAASSILDNFDKLQEVYEASLNSEGSAQEELDKYLDSINGKVAQFKNRLQELASVTIDSQWIKDIVSFGTEALGVLTGLSEKFGGINVILGTIGGIALQKNGYGLLNYNKKTGQFSNIFKKLGANSEQKAIYNGLSQAFSGQKLNTTMVADLMDSDMFGALSEDLQAYISAVPEAERGTTSLAAVLAQAKGDIAGAGQAFGSLGKMALGAVSAIGNMILVTSVMIVLEQIAKAIYNIANASQIAIEKGKQARSKIEDVTKTTQELNSTIDELGETISGGKEYSDKGEALDAIAERYAKLHKSVAAGTNKNVSLSNDEYQEYLNICNQIGQQFPNLVSGYDNSGNAILRLGNNAEQSAEKLRDLYDAQILSAHVEIGNNIEDSFVGKDNEIKAYEEEIVKLKNELYGITDVTADYDGHRQTARALRLPEFNTSPEQVADVLTQLGYEGSLQYRWTENGYVDYFFDQLDSLTEEQIAEINTAMEQSFEDLEVGANNVLKLKNIEALENKIEAAKSSKIQDLRSYLTSDQTFLKLSDEFQDAMLSYLSESLDADKLGKDFETFYQTELINKISDIAEDQDLADAINKVFSIQADNMSASDYTTKVYDTISQAFDGDNKRTFDLFQLLGFENLVRDFTEKRNAIIERFGGEEGLSDEQMSQLFGLSIQDLDTASNYILENVHATFDKMMRYIKDGVKDTPTDTLSSLFGDESYQKNTEGYEKKLSSLTGALETLRSEGRLTAEAMRDLQEEFPNLTDFSEAGLSKFGTKELTNWISEFKSGWTDFSEEGQKQLDTYLANFIASYSDVIVTETDAQQAVKDSITQNLRGYLKGVNLEREVNTEYQEAISALQDEYGEDLNWNIVLALKDQFTGDVEELKEKYGDYEMVWQIEVDRKKIQQDIDEIASERSLASARKALDEANGITWGADEYDADNALSDRLIADYEQQLAIIETKMESIRDEYKPIYQKLINEISAQILGEQTTQAENNAAKRQLPLTQLQNEATLLGLDSKAAQRVIENAKAQGKEVSEAYYQELIKAANKEKTNAYGRRDELLAEQVRLEHEIPEAARANNAEWIKNQQNLAEVEEQIEALRNSIHGWKKDIEDIPLTHLQTQLQGVDREIELINRDLEDSDHYATMSDYLVAMEKNAEKQINLQRQINEKRNSSDANAKKGSDVYIKWQNELWDLEDQLYNTTQAQEEFVKSLANLPVDNLTRAIEKYKNELQILESEQGYRQNKGFTLTDSDYDQIIATNQQMAAKSAVKGMLIGSLEAIAKATGNQKWAETLGADKASNASDYYGFLGAIFENKQAKKELPLQNLNKQLEEVKLQGQQAQNVFDEIARSGRDVVASDYDTLKANADAQIGLLEDIRDENIALSEDSTFGPEKQAEYAAAAVEAESSIAALTQQQYEYNEAIKQLPITQLINQVGGYTDLQREAADLENKISEADAKHEKVNEQLYDKLIKNGDKQIANLNKQKKEWQNLQNGVAQGSSKWQEYQGEIDNINNSIDSMRQNQLGWFESMTSIVSTNAATLSSTLSQAFSEINSETGLTIDTMNSLEQQFSDLSGRKIANIFYQSADGMKMNLRAAENLVDAEYELQTNNLYDTISKQQEIIEKYGNSETETAQKAVAAANQRIDAAQRELSMLQALYDQQKQNFSDFQQWQTATSTSNAGDRYTTIQGALKDVQQAYKDGLTGTDDFRTFTSMIDEWGVDTVAAYERSIEKVKRYFTEDASGLGNFFRDAVEKGWGEKTEAGYSLDIPDVVAFGHDMGLSQEMVDILLGRAEDYGVYNDWVSTRLDGEMKVKENMEELADAQLKYNELMREGADQDVLDNQQKKIDELESRQKNLRENTADVARREGKITSSQLQAGQQDLESLRQQFSEGLIDKETFQRKAQEIAEESHIILDADLNLDEEAMDKTYEGWNITPEIDWSVLDTQDEAHAESFYTGAEKIKQGFDDGNESLQGYLDTLSSYNPDDLEKITLSNKQYDVDGNLRNAEDALQGIADMFGLSAEEATQLLSILREIGVFTPEKTYQIETDTSEIDDAQKELEELDKEVEKPSVKKIIEETEAPQTGTQVYKPNVAKEASDTGTGNARAGAKAAETAIHNQEIVQTIKTVLASGSLTPDELEAMSEIELTDQFAEYGVEVNKEDLELVQQTVDSLSKTDGFDLVVKLDQSSIDAITTTTQTVDVDTEGATGKLDELAEKIENLPEGDAKVDADTANAQSKLIRVEQKVNHVNGLSATPSVDVTGNFDTATTQLQNLATAINNLKNKDIYVTVHKTTGGVDDGHGANGTAQRVPVVNGTAHVLGSALAYGTALAHGYWGNKRPGATLVGELGEEIVVDPHSANWYTVGSVGAEFVDLPKDAIVFNHKQTKSLFKNGWVTGRGKAYAGGKAFADPPASTNVGTFTVHSTDKLQQAIDKGTSTVKQATGQAKQTSKSTNNAAKKVTDAMEAFQKWLDRLKDWIEVRLQRWEEKMDLYTTKAENAVGAGNKNNYIASVEKWNNEQKIWNEKGEARYLAQADKVREEALKTGKVQKEYLDGWIEKIKNGTIDIEELTSEKNQDNVENIKKFIDAYSEWYDKAMECRQGVEDCIAKSKELEQMRLDNITDQFDTMLGYVEAVSGTSESLISLLTAKGAAINNATAKNSLQSQMKNQNTITGYLQAELEVYAKELARAKNIYKEGSNQYNEALTKYQEMLTAVNESEQKYYELNKTLGELDITVRDNLIARLKAVGENLASLLSLRQARNNKYSDANSESLAGYNTLLRSQVGNNQSVMQQYYNDIQHRMDIIGRNQWQVGSENYQEYYEAIMSDISAIYGLLNANEELKKSIRENNWKPFNDLQKKLEQTTSDFGHLREMITDAQLFDDNGEGTSLTSRGYASLALLAEQLATAKRQISDYRAALTKLTQDYKNGNITVDEYNETSREYVETIQNLAKATVDYEDQVAQVYEKQITNENNLLQELISSRKEALQSKKEYYEYDKKIRESNKDINQIRAQINALNGVTNMEAQAQRARLEEELRQKEEDLAETRRDHSYDLQQQGYDKLSEDANKVLEDTINGIQANAQQQTQVVNAMIDEVSTHYKQAYDGINEIINTTGTAIGDMASQSIKDLDGVTGKINTMIEAAKSDEFMDVDTVTKSISTLKITIDTAMTKAIESFINGNIDQVIQNKLASGKATNAANEASKNQQVNDAKNAGIKAASPSTPSTPSTPTTKQESKPAQQETDPIKAFINARGTYNKANDTSKSHLPLFTYVADKYGKTLTNDNQWQLGVLLGVVNGDIPNWWPGTRNGKTVKETSKSKATKQKIYDALKKKGYATGSRGVQQDELNWIHDNEIIMRRSDGAVLTPLSQGDVIFTQDQVRNLMTLSNLPVGLASGLSSMNMPAATGGNTTTNIHYDSLLTVNGNVDQSVLPRLEEILKQSYEYTAIQLKREARKVGMR